MRTTLERELKLDPPDGFVMPLLEGQRLPVRTFSSTYVDTEDFRLASAGVTLRYRVENRSGVWQLKLPRGDARLELEGAGVPARPPVELAELLMAHLRGRKLIRIARLRTRRDTLRTPTADIVDDAVAVYDGPRIGMRFRELEIELTAGEDATLTGLETALTAAGAGRSDGMPKLFRVLGLESAPERRLRRSTPPLEALSVRLRREYVRLLAHDPGVRVGDDEEDVHQMRVGARRLRAYLRVARPLVDRAWADELRAELAWLGSALGAARDLDVLVARLRTDVARELGADLPSSLLGELERERTGAYRAAVEALSDPRYLALLDRLERESATPLARKSGKQVRLARLFRRELDRCRRTFDALGRKPKDEALHDARISVKRARYAGELAAHELGDAGAAFLRAAKRLQDVLGEHQDAVVAQERIAVWLARNRDGAQLGKRLLEIERGRQAEARDAWPVLWRKLERRGRGT